MGDSPKPISLSPSKVDTFFGCKRLFFYRYVTAPFTPPENKYFLIGNTVHKALETLHRQHKLDPITDWRGALQVHFREAAKKYNVLEKVKRGVITADDVRSMKQMMKNYIVRLLAGDLPNVQYVETMGKIRIDAITVNLKADRVDMLEKDHYRVVDYKSGSVAKRADEKDSVQIPSYGLWLRQTINKDARIKASYYYLKHMNTPAGVHDYDVTDEWMKQAEEKYKQAAVELQRGCKYTPNYEYKYCRICDFRRYCLEDKRDV